jgi:Tfp pilus assembly ATPase PilU
MRTFKNIYESKNEKEKIRTEKTIINSPEISDYIRSSSMRLISILNKKDETGKQTDEDKDNVIIHNYNDFLETIKYLISILQFELWTES